MKTLFDDKVESFNDLGREVDRQFSEAISPLIKKAMEDGISLRDLHAMLVVMVDMEISCALLERSNKFYLKRKKDGEK